MAEYEEAERRFLSWTLLRRVAIVGAIIGLLVLLVVLLWFAALSRSVPSVDKLTQYEPPITSRVHAGDGSLIAEFANEHRVFVPYESIPKHVVEAFVAAEDKKFFSHEGLDFVGMTRGAMNSARNKISGSGGLQGGSTITQQVAKNMLLTRDQTITRKAKEAIIARRMERAFTKEQIMELYLNEIYLGGRSYGVGSAALNYFNKSLPELDLSEAAILASLAKAPSAVNPYTNPEKLLRRRNYVLGRMVEDSYITQEEADEAKALPLSTTRRLRGAEYSAATYFVQELRKELNEKYGEDTLQEGGLSIRTTIDTRLQLAAQTALQNGLLAYDRRHDYRGPLTAITTGDAWQEQLIAANGVNSLPGGYGDWEAAMVKRVPDGKNAVLLTKDGYEVSLPKEDVDWAKTWEAEGLKPGHVILIDVEREEIPAEPQADEDGEQDIAPGLAEKPKTKPIGDAILRQVPKVEGSLVALDPHTGRVLAMMGGYSFHKSQFNRVTQAQRQPGSAFKPFAYAAALEHGYTPASVIQDTPYCELDISTDKYWCPKNYTEGRSYGQVTMRRALEKSFNQVTARVANDIRLENVSELAERFGLYNELPPYTAMSLGSGDTTMLKMAKAYGSMVNGGREIETTLIDRVQDRYGVTRFRHDQRDCSMCQQDNWTGGPPPELEDNRVQLIDPVIAFQVTHMLEGVVQRGTGRRALRVGKPLAGKTGTTNDYKDAWFMGFSPDMVVGVWVGFDQPQSLGDGEAGGSVAAPIFTEFMQEALKDEAALPFRIPPGVRLVEIDADTGQLPTLASQTVILEAFQPGTAPGLDFGGDGGLGSIFGDSGQDSIFNRRPTNEGVDEDGFGNDEAAPLENLFPVSAEGGNENPSGDDAVTAPVSEEEDFDLDGTY